MNISMLIRAYKAIEAEEVKQKQFDALQATPLNYAIIRDLINSASNGVDITVTLVDGTKLEIKRKDAFDQASEKSFEAF